MELYLKYLKERRKVMGLLLLFGIIFFTTFALYHLPMKAVLYPTLVCMVIGVLCLIIDYRQVRKKHFILTEIQNLTAAMIGDFSSSPSIVDEDYQDIIKSLQQEVANLESMSNIRYQDMVDYYTVWVHQIKTPIASMRLTLQNEDTSLSRRLQSDLFRIEQYVEMVLVFLRLDSTTTDYVFKEHSIDTIVKQTVKRFSHEFIGRKIALEYETITKTVVTDDKWLSFVLEQVLSNALKYTHEGSIKIYLNEPNTLCVEDTGIGIAAEDLPRIFEKGYTGYNGRTDKKASGIGLYLCKRICKNLGFGIKAESEVGKGTIVKLDLEQYQLRKDNM